MRQVSRNDKRRKGIENYFKKQFGAGRVVKIKEDDTHYHAVPMIQKKPENVNLFRPIGHKSILKSEVMI